jgi:MtN3 and saliva related transmembrane protein
MDVVTVIGLIAGVMTTGSFIPQLIKALQTKSTGDISIVMYIVMVLGIGLWIVYGIYQKSLPLILANIVSLSITSTILYLKLRYN